MDCSPTWAFVADELMLAMPCGPAGTYGSQKREDYTTDDVEQYFNYMGMLAAEVQPFRTRALESHCRQA